jgi:hypothetical protein
MNRRNRLHLQILGSNYRRTHLELPSYFRSLAIAFIWETVAIATSVGASLAFTRLAVLT